MSSFLLPTAIDSCRTSLRERRRSSVNTIATVPRILTTALNSASIEPGSAILDDDEQSCKHSVHSQASIPHISELKLAQLPDHAPKITIPRHFDRPHLLDTAIYEVSSPTTSSPPTAMECNRNDYFQEPPQFDPSNMERIHWRLASGFFAYFMCGWGDGVTGTVLPHIKSEFNISFTMSSSLYAGGTVGFLFSTLLIETIMGFLGRFDISKTQWSWVPELSFSRRNTFRKRIGRSPSQGRVLGLLIASILHASFFIMMGTKSGFWVTFVAYAVAAFARSIFTASLNAYFVSGHKQSVGYAFAFWSFGGVVSPLICQALMARGVPYFQFYYGSLILSCFNAVFLVTTYMPTTREFAKDRESALSKYSSTLATPISEYKTGIQEKKVAKDPKTLLLALSMPLHWALSLFALVYCGCETTTQGFMASYLLGVRNANPQTAGYVTSGFWAGITISRLLWGHYTAKLTYMQRKWVVEGCILFGLAMQITVKLVDSDVQNSVAASIIGLVYGPVWPAILRLTTDLLPAEVHMASMAMTSAMASLGAALFPFAAGLVSSARGVHAVPYITLALASAIAVFWASFPSQVHTRSY